MLSRRALCLVALTFGCSPEVITAGYIERDASPMSPAVDGGSGPLDADAPAPMNEAGWLEPAFDAQQPEPADSSAPPQEAGTARVCFHLPDLLSDEAGAPRALEEGEVVGGLDSHWNCNPAAATTVTYARHDGAPLLRAGQRYALGTPAGAGGSINLFHGNEPCGQPWHSMIVYIALPSVPTCADVMLGEDRRFLRVPLSKPTPFPRGFTLCEGSCPLP